MFKHQHSDSFISGLLIQIFWPCIYNSNIFYNAADIFGSKMVSVLMYVRVRMCVCLIYTYICNIIRIFIYVLLWFALFCDHNLWSLNWLLIYSSLYCSVYKIYELDPYIVSPTKIWEQKRLLKENILLICLENWP